LAGVFPRKGFAFLWFAGQDHLWGWRVFPRLLKNNQNPLPSPPPSHRGLTLGGGPPPASILQNFWGGDFGLFSGARGSFSSGFFFFPWVERPFGGGPNPPNHKFSTRGTFFFVGAQKFFPPPAKPTKNPFLAGFFITLVCWPRV